MSNNNQAGNKAQLTLWTLDWVPDGPRGLVRDLRLRWACEEAGLAYAIATVPFDDRGSAAHLARQPFGQVPFLDDGTFEFSKAVRAFCICRTRVKQ